MNFIVENEIFEKIPDVCFGVVVARNVDNTRQYPQVEQFLNENIVLAENKFYGKKVKEDPAVIPYREAFRKLNINPNKYMSSIEALFTRIAKKKGMPHINPIVDLGNAISLKYTVPLGAHDITDCREDICVRLTETGDTFLPFGGEKEEIPDSGEVVYAVGHQVRTRRWTWRQSKHGKIGPKSADIFFPIDGFIDFNKKEVLRARDELAECLENIFHCETKKGYIDRNNREMKM